MTYKHNQDSVYKRKFILTFDDGPSPKTTLPLLDILATHNIKVVFFMLGKSLDTPQGAAVAHYAYDQGHIIGNHTYSHKNLPLLTKKEIRGEIELTHNLICDITGDCKYFRPPYRSTNIDINSISEEFEYETILWNVDSLDWKLKKNGKWVDHTIAQIENMNDCTILMHDIHMSTIHYIDELIMYIKSLSGHYFSLI